MNGVVGKVDGGNRPLAAVDWRLLGGGCWGCGIRVANLTAVAVKGAGVKA